MAELAYNRRPLEALGHRFATTPEIGATTRIELLRDGRLLAAEPTRRAGGPREIRPPTVTHERPYERLPLQMLRDPWDRFIVATAKVLNAPLVTADSKIADSGLVQVLW